MQRLRRIHVFRILKPQILSIDKQVHFARIGFRIYAVVEFDKFNCSKLDEREKARMEWNNMIEPQYA